MTRSRHALVGILALAVLLPLIPAGRRVLWESNEARYPVLAQDILEHGRWLVPEIRGQLYLNKPQLYFWTIALVSLPAGA
jgi:4-amino-4-deoxy-L-arabinose transferase-like glycosyltransferase